MNKKFFKSVMTMVLALVMLASLAIPAFAASKKTTYAANKSSITLEVGKTATVYVKKTVKDGKTTKTSKIDYKKVTYKTSDKKVATVSKKGVVTGKTAGTATIKMVYNKKTYSVKVKVTAPKPQGIGGMLNTSVNNNN